MLLRVFILVTVILIGTLCYFYPKPSHFITYSTKQLSQKNIITIKPVVQTIFFKIISTPVVIETGIPTVITQKSVIDATNTYRSFFGLQPLYYSSLLQRSANCQLGWLEKSNMWAHSWPGHKWTDCFVGIGGEIGENLATRFYSTEELMTAWEDSPKHRANLLDPVWRYTAISIGRYHSGYNIIVQHFEQ